MAMSFATVDDMRNSPNWNIYVMGLACACVHLLDAILAGTYAIGKTKD